MDTAKRIRRGNITVTEWNGEREVGCYLGNGRFGAIMASAGLNLSPEQEAAPNTCHSHFRHMSHWGRFAMPSPYTGEMTSADYLLPFFRLHWEKEWQSLTDYRQCHDLYDGVLDTRFCTPAGGSVTVTSWFDAVQKDLAGIRIEADDGAQVENAILLSIPTSFNPWGFMCRQEYAQTVTVTKTVDGWKITIACPDTLNRVCTDIYVYTDMDAQATANGLRFSLHGGTNTLLLSVGAPVAVNIAEKSLACTKEQNHAMWARTGWLDYADEHLHAVWVRSTAYLLASFDAACEYIQPSNSMGINGFPYNFVPDIGNIAPSLLMLGKGDIVRHWVEKFAGEIEDMRRYARRLWPETEGIFPPWELPFGPYEGYHAPTIPMIFFYEAHNAGYLAKLAMQAAEYACDEDWNRKYAYPLIDECAKFFYSACRKENDDLWHLHWSPCMGRDEAGGQNKDDYLCTLITAKYTFRAAIRCGLDATGRYARVLQEGLAFESLRSDKGTLHTCRGADDFGIQKHPVQLEGLACFPTEAGALAEEETAFRLRHSITADAQKPFFYGWTLAQLLMAGTNLCDYEAWAHDWSLLRPSDNTDSLWVQFYESCGHRTMAFYTATHGMVLQSLIRNCVNDYWSRLEIGTCLAPDAAVSFGNIRTSLGVTVSGKIENGIATGSITADRDTAFTFGGSDLCMKQGETRTFDFTV